MAQKASADESALSSAAAGASYNAVLSFSLRTFTFVLNAFAIRYVSKEIIGVANVRLLLLYTTITFVSREPFRKACLSKSEDRSWGQLINLTWFSFVCSVGLACILCPVWIYALERPDIPYYDLSVVLYAFCAVMEAAAEPLFILAQNFLYLKLKVITEGIGFGCQCLVTALLVYFFPHSGVLAFALAIVVYSTIYLTTYYFYFGNILLSEEFKSEHPDFDITSYGQLFPHRIPNKPFVDKKLANLVRSFVTQSFLKQLLTEGENYVMTLFSVLTFAEQGVYIVVNNLGSLVARLLFRPLEESFYLFFTKSLYRGRSLKEQNESTVNLVVKTLEVLLRFASLVGLTAVIFGYSYSYLALDLYGGSTLSSGPGPALLRWYALYVFVIAINGMTECFYFAAMSQENVDRHNQLMALFTIGFLFYALGLSYYLGAVGLILANCVNMLLRIAFSVKFIWDYFEGSRHNPISRLLPSKEFLFALGVAGIGTAVSERTFCCHMGFLSNLCHIAVGGLCGIAVLLVIYWKERELLDFTLKHIFKRNLKLQKVD